MCKKLGITALAVVGALFVLGNTRVGSYFGTAWNKVRTNAKKQVPLEFEIERVRHEVAKLVPDMKKNLSVIAEEMVAVENLRDDITTMRVKLDQQKQNILTMTDDLESGNERIVYGGKSYSRARITEKLNRDLQSYKNAQAELKTKEQLLDARERSLDAAREQMENMIDQKRELEVQIAELEVRLKTVRLAQTRCNYTLDDSRLSRCKESLAEIRNRLKVEQKETELHGEFANDYIPVEKKTPSSKEVAKEVREYFGEDGKPAQKVAKERK